MLNFLKNQKTMRKLLFFSGILLFLATCTSSTKLLQQGEYDSAVEKSVKKLQSSRTNKKEIEVLEKAYPLANQRNEERIRFLQAEGNPNRWEEILQNYEILKNRQQLARTVLPIQNGMQIIDFPVVDYDAKIIEAKKNAADYFYNHAKRLMDNNDKTSYRNAYFEFKKAQQYNPTYEDARRMADQAKFKGTNRALIKIINNTQYRLPETFKNTLLSLNIASLNTEWGEYYTQDNGNTQFDYFVYINLKNINLSPERLSDRSFTEKREIQDGYEYVLDDKGNVRKDSLGNDMKKPKYKTISCEVIDHIQEKSCRVSGHLEFELSQNRQIVKTKDIAADNFFKHVYTTANGDLNALSAETKDRLKRRPIPFPADMQMIEGTVETFRKVVQDALHHNRKTIE